MTSRRWILTKIGKVYKHAHDLAMKTKQPEAQEIITLCEKLAEKYAQTEKTEENP